MTQTFKLKKGELSFERDKIIISDDAKKQKRLTLLTSSMWTIYGTLSVLRYLKTGDQFLLWTGLPIGLGHLLIFVMSLSRYTSYFSVRYYACRFTKCQCIIHSNWRQ